MTTLLKTTEEFINKSIGEWKSIRSSHTLAFQEFENTTSNITISYLNIENYTINNLLNKFNFKETAEFAINVSWQSESDWMEDKEISKDNTILIFLPKDNLSGILLRNKGYTESIPSHSDYKIKENILEINTEYNSTLSQEKIWFLSDFVRTRFSVIRNKSNNSIIQTSHTSEIKKLAI